MNSTATQGLVPNRIQFTKATRNDVRTSLSNKNTNVFGKKLFGSSSSAAVPTTTLTTTTATNKQSSNNVVIEQLTLPPQSKWISQVSVDPLATWTKANPPSRGLNNLGNTCFMNSTLQCLASIPTFVQFLQLQDHSQHCTIPKEELCIFCYVEKFVGKTMQTETTTANISSCATPKTLANNIRILGKQFRVGRQEDSHEFLRCLLDRMVRNALRVANVKEGSKDRMDETTAIHRIFGGYFRNQVHCTSCNYDSNSYDAFLDLSLEVGNGISSVDKALRQFSAKETLDERNKWKCPRCKKDVRAVKQLTIRVPPPVLTIQLKRFSFTPRVASTGNSRKDMMRAMFAMMGGGTKLTAHVEFSDKLDITPALADSALQEKVATQYYLHGVLVHNGHSANSGHYYSYVKAPNNAWYCMNDSSVSSTAWNIVSKQQAYMLFYSRIPPTYSRTNTVPKPLSAAAPSLAESNESKKAVTVTTSSSSSSTKVSASMDTDTNSTMHRSTSSAVPSSSSAAIISSSSSSSSSSTTVVTPLPDNVDDFENVQWMPSRKNPLASSSRLSFPSSSKAATLPEKLLGVTPTGTASPSASTAAALASLGDGKQVSVAGKNPSASILSTTNGNGTMEADIDEPDNENDDDDAPSSEQMLSTTNNDSQQAAYWRKKQERISESFINTLAFPIGRPRADRLSRSLWDRQAIVDAHKRLAMQKNTVPSQHLVFDETNESIETDAPASVTVPPPKTSTASVANPKVQRLLQKSLDMQRSLTVKQAHKNSDDTIRSSRPAPLPAAVSRTMDKERLDSEDSEAPEEVSFTSARKDVIAANKQLSQEVNKSKKELRLLQKPKIPTVSPTAVTNQHVRIDDEGNETRVYRPRSPELEPEQGVRAPNGTTISSNSSKPVSASASDESMNESSSSESETETVIPLNGNKTTKEVPGKPVSNPNPFASTLQSKTKNTTATKKPKKTLENVEITGKRRASETFNPSMLMQHSTGLQVKPSPSSVATTLLSATPTLKPAVKGWDDEDDNGNEATAVPDGTAEESATTVGAKRDREDTRPASLVQPKWSDKLGRNALEHRDRLWDEQNVSEEEWNQILDTGRRKKIKVKDDDDGKNNQGPSFQAALDKQREQRSTLPDSGQGYRKGSFRTEREMQGGRGGGGGHSRGSNPNFRGKHGPFRGGGNFRGRGGGHRGFSRGDRGRH